jgi:hypothetical protein
MPQDDRASAFDAQVSTERAEPPAWHAPFAHAVVRIATYFVRGETTSRLVFATIELLAPGRPRPASGLLQEMRPAGGTGARVYFRRVAMGAAEAIAWYEAAMRGNLVTPQPCDLVDDGAGRGGQPIAVGPWTTEPPWPALVLPLDGDPLLDPTWPGPDAPFIGSGAHPARISRLLGPSHMSLAALARDEAVSAFLKPRLHLDLARYPECQGGMALIVPDPIVREVQMFVRPRSVEELAETIVARILPRAGAALSGLEMTFIEVRAGALRQFVHIAVPPDGLVVWEHDGETAMVGYVLTHAVHGVLRQQAPAAFLRKVSLSSSIASRRVTIHARTSDSPSAPEEPYDVTEYVGDRQIEIGHLPRHESGLFKINRAAERRRRLAAAERQGQRWLDDSDEARVHIRGILEGASQRIWVADPYLGGLQIFQFIHAASRLAVEIRLITSRLAFEQPSSLKPKGDGADLASLAGFAEGLEGLDRRGFADVEAWVLRGKVPPLHDRFLVVDDAVWLSGNSLNSLGTRAGLILKVPDPEPIIARLGALRRRADLFDEFRTARITAEGARRGEGADEMDPGVDA